MPRISVKKEDIIEFNNSDIGKIKNYHLKKAKITGIILIMFALLYLIYMYLNDGKLVDYIIVIMTFIFGIYFIINTTLIKYKEVNKYIYEKKSLKK